MSEETDQSTNKVIDWIHINNKCFTRINTESFIDNVTLYLNNEEPFKLSAQTDEKEFSFSHVSSFWYRRGALTPRKVQVNDFGNSYLKKEILKTLSSEWMTLNSFVINQLETKRHLGNYDLRLPNKLAVLQIAQQHEIDIPDTMVTSSLKRLKEFKNKYKEIITKPLFEIFMYADKEQAFISRTEAVTDSLIEVLADDFFPMLFQENLQKLFEVRVFFINGKFFPAAFFSQNDENTKTDFRNGSKVKYRTVPFSLPAEIFGKLKKMMIYLRLNTGSIDLVYTREKRFVFLEVNPVGQFDVVSEECNYFIEKKIAEYLSE